MTNKNKMLSDAKILHESRAEFSELRMLLSAVVEIAEETPRLKIDTNDPDTFNRFQALLGTVANARIAAERVEDRLEQIDREAN